MMGVPQWRSPEKEKQSAKSAKRKGGFGVVCDKNSFEEQAAAKRLSTQACTYPNKFVRSDKKRTFQVLKRDLPKRGCCCKQECCSRYKPEQVAAVRAYFLSRAKADRRAQGRTDPGEPRPHGDPGQDQKFSDRSRCPELQLATNRATSRGNWGCDRKPIVPSISLS